MTKRYKTLRNKLTELKAELMSVFSLPEEKTPYLQLLSQEIEQRFLFIKNLLSAEIASDPSKPHHLHHIARRLNELETAFREWDHHRKTSAAFDSTSICSCDDSCRNDDGEAAYDEDGMPDLDSNSVCEVDEEGLSFPAEGLVDVNVEQDMGVKKVENGEGVMAMKLGKSYCGGVIGGMIFGVVLMAVTMLRFSGCFYFVVHDSFLIPT